MTHRFWSVLREVCILLASVFRPAMNGKIFMPFETYPSRFRPRMRKSTR